MLGFLTINELNDIFNMCSFYICMILSSFQIYHHSIEDQTEKKSDVVCGIEAKLIPQGSGPRIRAAFTMTKGPGCQLQPPTWSASSLEEP